MSVDTVDRALAHLETTGLIRKEAGRKTKEILRLHYELSLGMRQIARSLSISHTTASNVIKRAETLGLAWPLPAHLNEAAIEALIYPDQKPGTASRPEPD